MNRILFAFVLFLTCLASPSLWAQNAISGGSISGIVTDSSGGAVVGATVNLKNVGTGVQLTTKTNGAGAYNFPVLNVGTYTMSFTKDGFKTTEVKDVIVQVGQTTAQNVSLEVGSLTQSITVTASAPLLRPTESTVSTVVDQKLIQDLPLSGRRYTDFVLLTPNVNTDGQFGLVSVGGQQGGGDSGYANGNGSNSFTVDGANDTSNYFGDARGRTRVPYIFGEQAVQEFQVADSPYSAAYGGAGTGFINTVTKSGTDTLHGGAFYYNRNSGTGANDAVDKANGVPRLLNVLQQFGGDVGGPIVPHKVWFYFDYEEQRQTAPISVITGYAGLDETAFGVPTGTALPAPNSYFPVPGSFNMIPAVGTPNYAVYLQNVSNALHVIAINQGQRARRRDDYSVFPKLDWQLGSNDHFTFVYNYNRFNSPGGEFTFNPVSSEGVQALPNNFVRDHHATIHWSHAFSSAVLNDFHVSFLRDEQIPKDSGLIPANVPQVLLFARGFFTLGNPSFVPSDTKEFQWSIGEQIDHTRGRHNFKFGFDFNRTHVSDFFPGTFLGSYGFFSLSSFALGRYGFFNQNTGNPLFPFSFPYYGFYAQDKFQVRHNLTLDLGVREDFQVFSQPAGNPNFPLTSQFPNRYSRISPRIGFAYQPMDKTVVRGGFGMFYMVFNGINYENSVIANGLASHQSSASASFDPTKPANMQTPTFSSILPTNNGTFSASSNISLVDPDFKTPYVLESSLEIQREIFSHTTIGIGTLWTHAVHLISSTARDLNLNPLPTGTTSYKVCPANTIAPTTAICTGPTITAPTLDAGFLTEGRLTSNFNQINALITPGLNNYNSFYAQLQRRVSEGLSIQMAYTYSKAILRNGADFNNQFDFSNTRGPSLLDQRHRLSIAAAYSPDASHLSRATERALLSNWTISTVMGFNSGRPYTAVLGGTCTGPDFNTCNGAGNSINNSAVNEGTGNTSSGINGGSAPSPTQGYNAFYGPWINEIDLGIARSFHLTERHSITFKVQAFNLFNHANFFVQSGSGVSATQYDPIGPTCGDGMSVNQQCFLVPHAGFGTLQSISELNGPRVFQFALYWKF